MAQKPRVLNARSAPLVLAALLASACTSMRLDESRQHFYAGRPNEAAAALAEEKTTGRDRVLILMERGTARMAAGDYERSAQDFIQAHDEIERMTAIQVAQDTTSMAINDTVQDYHGPPYERTLLHAFTAKDHLAVQHWENAAVEARRILESLDAKARGDYPDVAYARYLAGFCLELMDDKSNAALQYRKAGELTPGLTINDRTGRLGAEAADAEPWPAELVCFILIGGTHQGGSAASRRPADKPMYAEIRHEGRTLGRSYPLSDTVDLAFTTGQKEAARKLAKTATRVVIKETVAYQVSRENELLGELVRLILVGLLEQEDVRRWETLPRWLQVARVSCPEDLKEFDVVFRNASGGIARTVHLQQPLGRRRNTFVSFCRDLPAPHAQGAR